MSSRRSRVCMVTMRDFAHRAFTGGMYDGQDVLVDVDDVDLICLKPARGYNLRQNIQKRLLFHDFTKTLGFANMAFDPIKLTKEYDLFVAYLPFITDLIQVPAVQGWKDYCRTSVCWIDVAYTAEIPKLKYWWPALVQFDHIVIGFSGVVSAVTEAIKRPCHFVPIGVDALRFSPYPHPPDRVIDVYSMSRRSEAVHRALLELAAKQDMFYIYDTVITGNTEINDHRQHRQMLANILKRTRYFIVAPAVYYDSDWPDETAKQIELGLRYYEGSAAGTVMVGHLPYCETSKTMFNWHDAVIEIQPDGSDLADVISSLTAQPKRLEEISRRNAMEALLRHDWAYRWRKILDIAGLDPAPQLEIRENTLKQLAEQAGNG
jgi:Glycosyl transferases group 1